MSLKERRLNVLLDLDNTIINSLESKEIKNISPDIQSQFFYKDMDNFFRVFARPHLDTFLDYLFDNYNVGVYTAAESSYALFIVNNFILTKPGRKLNLFMYRYHVTLGEQRYGEGRIKDLRLLWEFMKLYNYYPCNTVLIDDLSDVKKTNPKNVIAIPSFDMVNNLGSFNKSALTDTSLLNVMDNLDLLNSIYKQSYSNLNPTYRYTPILN